jgi:SAM-dependent methyltransferase
MIETTPVVENMRDYYARRASYYERVYFKPERQDDLRAMEAWLPAQFEGRAVLEVACGTGWWTPHGARAAAQWLATDINEETLAIARAKPMPACVRFAEIDAYTLADLTAGPGERPLRRRLRRLLVEPRAADAPGALAGRAALPGCNPARGW